MKQTAKGPVLIVGARSDIGQALASAYAAEGADLILAARQAQLLDPFRSDLELRHRVMVELVEYDLLAADPEDLVARLPHFASNGGDGRRLAREPGGVRCSA